MILVVFHTAGINETNIYIIIMKKKNFGTDFGWATAQVSLRLGWALGWAMGAGRTGAGIVGTAQAAWARGYGAHGRRGGRRWGAEARRARWEWQAWARGAQASGRAHGRAQPARGHGMDAQGRAAGARRAAVWEACARLVCAAGPGWVFCCT